MSERASPGGGILGTLVRKELREVARDGRFWIVALAIAALLIVALAFGLRQSAAVHAEREAAQGVADDHFRDQDEKNPHVAAHYGAYVFKPSGALAFVDPGIDPFVGVSIKLQAHKRTPPAGARAQDSTSLARVGRLSVAAVLQLLVPLLIIGLGFSSWTAERERGTMRLLATSGVDRGRLFVGKALGLGAALGAVLVPASVVGAIVIAWSSHGPAPGARLAALIVVYLVYFGIFLGLTLGVSARASSSRAALVTLLGVWVITTLVLPRAAADVAALVAPTPAPAEVAGAVHESLTKGLPGGPPREERVDAITEKLLEEQGFKDAEMLMDASLLAGIELQAEAQFENEVLDHHYEALTQAAERQESVVASMAAVAPPIAIQSLSSSLAGTDYVHHRHFTDAAESHRRALIDMLNRELAEKGGLDAWSYQAGRETWERAPRFQYAQPELGWVLQRQRVSLALLCAWFVAAMGLAWRGARRMRVV